jgi:aminopeptidase C
MVQAGQPVFFGCDVGQFSDNTMGVMDTALFQYEVRLRLLILAPIHSRHHY